MGASVERPHAELAEKEMTMNEEQKIFDEYLNRIKVQLVNLKFSFSPSKLKGKRKGVPKEF